MAAPLTHLILADKIYQKHFVGRNRELYLLGTSFPDIRYLGTIDRSKTHFLVSSIEDCIDEDDFICGMKIHSLVDIYRNQFMEANGIQGELLPTPNMVRGLKIFEDMVGFELYLNENHLFSFFNTVLPKTAQKILPDDAILLRWYGLLSMYCNQKPSVRSQMNFLQAIVVDPKKQSEILDAIEKYKQNSKLKALIEEFFKEFLKNFA